MTPINENEKQNSDFVPNTNGYIAREIFVGTKDTDIVAKAYDNKLYVLLAGETGTGKTHLIRHLCHEKKLPYKRINLNGGTTCEDLLGSWTPANDGGFKWTDGVLTRFVRNGGVIVLDEINSAPADVLFVLNSLLDDEHTLLLTAKDGELIHANPNFWICATYNPDYEGTKPINEALKDRFSVHLSFDYDNKIEMRLVNDEGLVKVANKLREMYKRGELLTPTSTRALIGFKKNVELFGQSVACELFAGRYATDEQNSVSAVLEVIKGEKQRGFKK